MTKAELRAEKNAEVARKREEERLEKEAEIQVLREDLEKTYNGTFKSINEFMDRYTWRSVDYALALSAERFRLTFSEKIPMLCKKEIEHFLSIGVKLVKKGVMDFEYFKNCVSSVEERKEEDNFVENK